MLTSIAPRSAMPRLSAAASASHVTGGQVERHNRVICPTGILLTCVSSLISDFPKDISVAAHPKSSRSEAIHSFLLWRDGLLRCARNDVIMRSLRHTLSRHRP